MAKGKRYRRELRMTVDEKTRNRVKAIADRQEVAMGSLIRRWVMERINYPMDRKQAALDNMEELLLQLEHARKKTDEILEALPDGDDRSSVRLRELKFRLADAQSIIDEITNIADGKK